MVFLQVNVLISIHAKNESTPYMVLLFEGSVALRRGFFSHPARSGKVCSQPVILSVQMSTQTENASPIGPDFRWIFSNLLIIWKFHGNYFLLNLIDFLKILSLFLNPNAIPIMFTHIIFKLQYTRHLFSSIPALRSPVIQLALHSVKVKKVTHHYIHSIQAHFLNSKYFL